MQTDYTFKLLLIGDSGVGKSSLLLRFTDNEFREDFVSTIGVDFYTRLVTIEEKLIRLGLWDTAGQERFRTITSSYYRGAHGVILVYDVSDRASFSHLSAWLEDSQRFGDRASVMIVGTKADLPRQVTTAEAQAWAAEHGCLFVECSAKDPAQTTLVTAVFLELAQTIYSKRATPPLPSAPPTPKRKCQRCC